MSATQKFFRKPFGEIGDRAAVPDLTAPDGSVSYETGYGNDYQRAAADPLVKNPERTKLNQVLYDVTLAVKQYQTHGFPEFIQSADNGGAPFPYSRNACVLWTDGQIYVSLVDANTSTPADVTKWQLGFGSGVGGITHFPATVPPPGYLKANGAILNRADFPVLWAYAQASGNLAVSDGSWQRGQFSPGDGALTFRIPDWRGRFTRALDDGAGIDTARVLGTVQGDTVGPHGHPVNDPQHNHGITDPGHAHNYTAALTATPGGAEGGSREAAGNSVQTTSTSGTNISINSAGTGVSVQTNTGTTETRPTNIAALACIKFQ